MLLLMHRTGSNTVTVSSTASSRQPQATKTKSPRIHQSTINSPIQPSELVYLEASPDFCDADDRTGTPGTAGRRCNATASSATSSSATDGDRCDVMCCGRGYLTERRTVVEKCRCRFHWCCNVYCEHCKKTVIENVCR